MGKNVTRLFNNFIPEHYSLTLVPDRDAMTFTGTVVIKGKKVGRPSQRLTFHQKDLHINSATLTKREKRAKKTLAVDRINHHSSYDEVRLHATEMVYPGEYTVELQFEGKITRQMNGVYPCFFKLDGTEKKLIATQFESHHAREVFPCIDEPEAKATFDLTLTSPVGEEVIANTPVDKQIEKDGNLVTTFQTTPKMSTYLLAFVYGDMRYKEARTRDGVTVRTYATPENVEYTQFALDVAVKCLEFYNDYFGIPYPLPKCDMVALPDFASGAMENWGCITYREHAMLVDPENTTLSSKQYVAMVVAHELAHQWFGNLVTMRWWTDLWLNEGFASWVEYMAVDHLFPEWDMWTQFTVDEQQQALKLDALEHTHPIEVPVRHPDEIRTIFDAISYSKGASVIHMLHKFLGAEDFQKGLRLYLERHKYANTDTTDLWTALEEASSKPVKTFMHAWTSLPGFPVLHADISDKLIQLRQERFFVNPEHSKIEAANWPIATLSGNESVPEILDTEELSFSIDDTSNFKFNRGQSGFYRTTYNSEHLDKLGKLIQANELEPLDRLGILSDMFESAKSGQASTVEALRFINNFSSESNYVAWDVMSAAIGSTRSVMDSEELRDAMKPYIRKLIAPQLSRLGWDSNEAESHFDRLLRPLILSLSATADEPAIVAKCRELFDEIEDVEDVAPHLREIPHEQQVKRSINIDPDLRGTVFGTVARLGDENDYDKLIRLHNASSLSEERTTIAAAITGFKQERLIARALSTIRTDDVRLQDVPYWLAYSFMNRYGKHQTWEWMKQNWEWLQENLGSDLSFYRMPIYAARAFSEPTFKQEFIAFFEPKMSVALERSYNQGLEMLSWQAAWKKRDFDSVLEYFSTLDLQ